MSFVSSWTPSVVKGNFRAGENKRSSIKREPAPLLREEWQIASRFGSAAVVWKHDVYIANLLEVHVDLDDTGEQFKPLILNISKTRSLVVNLKKNAAYQIQCNDFSCNKLILFSTFRIPPKSVVPEPHVCVCV